MSYDKTEMNAFVQSLYDQKMQEGKHGHYETMFHVVHKAIERAAMQSAQPIAQPLPLTDEQIKTMWAQYAGYIGGVLDFARAIEAAHGIGGAL